MNPLARLEVLLRDRVREEESRFAQKRRETDSLFCHLQRVAGMAERLGAAEGMDPVACRLAGLFHDAGKFRAGGYHEGTVPEEEQSVEVLVELAGKTGLHPGLTKAVSDAILQLYRDDSPVDLLARILFDADNLDKLGFLGIANYFVKTGLRGSGVAHEALYSLTVELTYARHAADCMATKTGREQAAERARQTEGFIHELLASLRQDGAYDFQVSSKMFEGLAIDVVAPTACLCGEKLRRRIWGQQGVKCSEIHLEHSCAECGFRHAFRFCRPRLAKRADGPCGTC